MMLTLRSDSNRTRPKSQVRNRRQGTTVVESAIVIPVFFVFVFGLVEIGRAFMAGHLLTNAARVGCRQGVLSNATTSDITAAVDAALAQQGINGYTTTVAVNGVTADASGAQSTDEISVSISVPVSKITWLAGGNLLKGSLTGRYTLRRE